MTALKTARIRAGTHRLIASRYPTIGVFDDLAADAEDLRAAFLLESLTNDRLSAAAGRLTALPAEEIVSGPGATLVMAAFLHANEEGGRFTDGRLGAWYASLMVKTAIRETPHHATARLAASKGGFPNRIQMRELVARVDAELVDIRGQRKTLPALYAADDYREAQRWAMALRWPAQPPPANGIVFDAVRHAGGTNVCIYRPSLVKPPVTQGSHFEYHWDAAGQAHVVELKGVAV